ncbi:hypothetical protein [Actinoplanes sp. NBRC 103695]|uniref:hypothetical protein n=1 Tax=Actinoplanes sp. NBRC 103695 TaxID=3032202 RepID=UPI0024A45469|nr:hypothetical protein [Actinoplanes sp. NBRC 103695]GLY97738.1 hypothetical protein Acsp02_49920 [Actinoplanes sp. NBRC 103695]
MRVTRIVLSVLAAFGLTVALAPAAAAAATRTYSYDFTTDAQGWTAGFADYDPNSGDLNLESGIATLPSGAGSGKAFFIQGHNRSDDLYMFFKRRLGTADGIVAGQRYSVRSAVTFWSEAPAGECPGSGGSEGAAVYVKAGASTAEPTLYMDNIGHYRVHLDKGNNSVSGSEATVIGDIENGHECGTHIWTKVTRTSTTTLTVQADGGGNLWLNAGTDSGYEGITRLYYTNISITLATV